MPFDFDLFISGSSVGLGYIEAEEKITRDYLESGKIEVDVGGVPVAAKASLMIQYDPKAERMRSSGGDFQ